MPPGCHRLACAACALAALLGFAPARAQQPAALPCAAAGAPCAGLVSADDFLLDRLFGQFLTQDFPGIPDAAEPGDHFGYALAAGDFNGDGVSDLAIGAPYETTPMAPFPVSRGAVHALLGSRDRLVTQPEIFRASSRDSNSEMGYALGAGDFNGDRIADLVIGSPGENLTFAGAGVIFLIPGSGDGLVSQASRLYAQDMLSIDQREAGDSFGSAFATGDFDGDGFDDLAVGAPGERVNNRAYAGAVNAVYARTFALSLPLIEK